MNFVHYDFNPLYDAIHQPFFHLESIMNILLPFSINNPLKHAQSIHSKSLPLMDIKIPLFFVMSYLIMCQFGKQRTSKFNHPYLRLFVNIYNASLVVLSAFMVLTILVETTRLGYSWFNNPIDESKNAKSLSKALSIFYLSKYPELLDTVIMIIKGNKHQITFLHQYHHSSIILIWFVVVYVSPYSEAYFCALLNCSVHTLMYSYYLFTNMKLMTWFTQSIKKYMTLMQMVKLIDLGPICNELRAVLLFPRMLLYWKCTQVAK
eukprot:NODE_685_length_4747_cov_0.548623.p3 type:complete len:263 gc:universal NODE_685_length_4747_cov_0.548623:1772-2560(+)